MLIDSLFVNHVKSQINIHCDIGGDSVPNEFVLKWVRKKGRKRIEADWLYGVLLGIRGRKFPLSLNLGGYQITVIVEGCVNGVPRHLMSGNGEFSDIHAGANARSGILDLESKRVLGNLATPVSDSIREPDPNKRD